MSYAGFGNKRYTKQDYRQYKDMNADVSRDINARCESISTLYIEIEECRLRILYERGLKECKNCRKENPLEHAYCSACGMKFPETNDVSVLTKVETYGSSVASVSNPIPQENPEAENMGGDVSEPTPADTEVLPKENNPEE